MCATAWNIIGGFAGQYSFGHAAFLGIGAYTSTLMYLNLGISPWLGMIVGGIVAALAGAVISYPCFRLRGAFFSLATIAFAEMLRVGGELTDTVFGILINGARGLVIPPVGDSLWALQFRDKESYAYVIYGLLLVTLAVAFTVKNSRLGYYLAAIGDDEDAVKSLGIDTARAKLIALLVSAFFTAVAGSFYAQMVLFITHARSEPRSVGTDGHHGGARRARQRLRTPARGMHPGPGRRAHPRGPGRQHHPRCPSHRLRRAPDARGAVRAGGYREPLP
jgi:branched-chain amino acid transport system permease protein